MILTDGAPEGALEGPRERLGFPLGPSEGWELWDGARLGSALRDGFELGVADGDLDGS